MTVVTDYTALISGYSWNGMTGAAGAPVFITYAFVENSEVPSLADYEPYPNNGYFAFTTAQRASFRHALTQFETIAGVRFIEVDDPEKASIDVMNTSGSAWAGWANYGASADYYTSDGYLVIDGTGTYAPGTSQFETILHEIGHAMGLKHPFDDDPTLASHLDNDNYTLMSYTSNGIQDTSLAPFDVQALQSIYGPASGIDGGWSWSWSDATGIFMLSGSGTDDKLIAVDAQSTINGMGGNDTLWGREGDDTLNGGDGNDVLYGGQGNNYLDGGDGDDRFVAGWGTDTYVGGSGIDVVDFGTRTYAAYYTLASGGDIENIYGSDYNDYLTGNDLANELRGGDGEDRLFGADGHDVLNGGADADTMYGGIGDDVFVVDNAGDQAIEYAGHGTDTVRSSISFGLWQQNEFLENLILTDVGNINATGNDLANILTGNSGDNVLNGGVGADRMVGGLGNDSYYVDNAGDTTIELAGQGNDSVFSSVSYFLWSQSQHIEILTLTGWGNNDGGGNALANTITGNTGNNVLNGGVGADRMVGGAGNDTYHVDNVGDTTIEMSGQGTDSVFSSVSYFLWNQSQHIENLTLIGAANIDGGGNGLANTLTGNAGNNVLNGGGGADRMVGGAGNDTYHVDNVGDTTVEWNGQGIDTVISSISFALKDQNQFLENLTLAGSGNINGTGNGLANTINGNSGNNILNGAWGDDTLNGGAGNDIFIDDGGVDRMVGGEGDDIYYVGNVGDTTIEMAGQGTDTVFSSVDFFLWNKSQHIENLTLIGTANIDGGGNGLANTITGNAGNNVLNGGDGADRMVGGQGNDTYYVDNFGDTTIEVAGQGTDLVMASVGFALRDKSQHIENLTLIGTGHIYGTGNGLANTITGNSGNNGLNGAWGNDTLIGGAGNDIFRDDAGNDIFTGGTGADTFFFLSAGESDRITDFENGIDTMTIGLGVNSFANITVTDSGADTILTFGSNTVTLENFDHTLVSSDDFTFV